MLNRSTQRSAANYFAMSMLFKFSMTWDSLELWGSFYHFAFRTSYLQGDFWRMETKMKSGQSADDSDVDVNALPTVAAISS